ncbi:DUF3048 domain-containing protein [Streptomyces acidicola]|uniref:DUF3048 domain-containing protein n=1 Tax=Streptomyces acidicola TaxID=2596892 RepID=UPI0037A48DC8
MRQGTKMRRGRMTAALLAVAMGSSLMAGCGNGSGNVDGRGKGQNQEQGPGEDRVATAPTGSALAVKVDNTPTARPQTGLDAADVVYAEQVEGGLSRLMAVYATRLPDAVGPVRSARESDLELLRQFDKPTLAFSGVQSKLLPLIDKAPLHPKSPRDAAGAYYRSSGKPAPHNLYLRPKRLMGSAPGADVLTTGYHYGAAPSGGTPENSRTVSYPAARFTFTWSGSQKRWLVTMDGTPTVTADGKRVSAGTVVVQYVKVRQSRFQDFLGNNTPYTETVGSGRAQVLRDGRAYDVSWKREKPTDGTDFTTADGRPVNLAKGPVWVVFAKAS